VRYMTSEIQLAKASRLVPGKGEDCVFSSRLNSSDCFLMGVADGISTANGGDAARWIKESMDSIAMEPGAEFMGVHDLFERFQELLENATRFHQRSDSHSTLSCGIGRRMDSKKSSHIRFEFFGIGDSPIWRVVPCQTGELTFQVSPVYSPPTPSEQGGVYSSVNLGAGRIDGKVHFGSVDIEEGELLIVATDGLPDARVIFDDQDPERVGRSPKLIDTLLRSKSFDDAMLINSIATYDANRLLIDDDASLAVARWGCSSLSSSEESYNRTSCDQSQIEPDSTPQTENHGMHADAELAVNQGANTSEIGSESLFESSLNLESLTENRVSKQDSLNDFKLEISPIKANAPNDECVEMDGNLDISTCLGAQVIEKETTSPTVDKPN